MSFVTKQLVEDRNISFILFADTERKEKKKQMMLPKSICTLVHVISTSNLS